MMRGAFGAALRRVDSNAYAQIFEPVLTEGPSGLLNPPRPFVFRVAHLDGAAIAKDGEFPVDVHLFSTRNQVIEQFVSAFGELAREGLGLKRVPMLLTSVEHLDLVLPLDSMPDPPVDHVRVRFVTPCELKADGERIDQPEFGVLMARIRDRLSGLSALYGAGPLPLDFAPFGERARQIEMTRCELRYVHVGRVSARTGQRHSLGGFVGEADYRGNLTEFVPLLNAAQYTGVGRQTTWGKGEILVRCQM